MGGSSVVLFLAGDVMTGRGVDQLLPCPSSPELHEGYVTDARGYVDLAERVSGPVPRPVDPAYPWGEALDVLDAAAPDVRLVNLETSVTRSGDHARGKGIHYRMHPANVSCLTAARIDVCVLANNHVLDYGTSGLVETLETLRAAGLRTAGAGRDAEEAWAPAAVAASSGRVLVWSVADASSGVPPSWAAGRDQPGVALLPGLSRRVADEIGDRVRAAKVPGDVAVVSVHWGSNWGYDVPPEQERFAHRLVEDGVDVVHGHSSHHPRPVEVYRDRLVLYGCGDLVNDYEGIGGYEEFRSELRLLYLAEVEAATGALRRSPASGRCPQRMVPLRSRRMRLERTGAGDARWLRDMLRRTSRRYGTRFEVDPAGDVVLGVP